MKRGTHRTSLHAEIAHQLREFIQAQLKPAEALPPIRQLADQLGVSTATLRAAQALLCQDGLLQVVHGSGVYVTDRAAHRLVAIMTELDVFHEHVSGHYHALIHHLRAFFQTHQVRTRLYVGEVQPGTEPGPAPTCSEFVTDCAARRFDGIVTIGTDPDPAWMKWVNRFQIPFVSHQQVGWKIEDLIGDGLRLLREQGCQQVAVLWWDKERSVPLVRDLIAAAGLQTQSAWLRYDLHPSAEGAGWDEFREIWTAGTTKPDGLLVLDEMLFEGVVEAITAAGVRVPEQMKVVLQTHPETRRPYPFPVTALELDTADLARAMGDMLLKQMNHAPLPARVVTLRHRVVPKPAWTRTPQSHRNVNLAEELNTERTQLAGQRNPPK